MSHYNDFETQITNKDALIRALCRCDTLLGRNWVTTDIEVHDQAQHLYGYKGDVRPEVAHVIIRKGKIHVAANDIGFVKAENGKYRAIISEYDQKYHNPLWQSKLYTYYNIECSKIALEKKGMTYTEVIDDKGRIQLRSKFTVQTSSKIKVRS